MTLLLNERVRKKLLRRVEELKKRQVLSEEEIVAGEAGKGEVTEITFLPTSSLMNRDEENDNDDEDDHCSEDSDFDRSSNNCFDLNHNYSPSSTYAMMVDSKTTLEET